MINCLILWLAFEKEFRGFSRGITRALFASCAASVLIGMVAYVGLNIFGPLFDTETLFGIFLQGAVAGLLATVVGVLVLRALKSEELSEIFNALHQRFWKAKVIATDQEII
jgi:hypothetical protein